MMQELHDLFEETKSSNEPEQIGNAISQLFKDIDEYKMEELKEMTELQKIYEYSPNDWMTEKQEQLELQEFNHE